MSTTLRKGRKSFLLGATLGLMMALWSLSIQAQQECVISNWAGGATGLTNANAGTQGAANRRYGGPCGLRVPVNGAAFVSDNSPNAESTYIARFYVFLNNAGSAPIILFAADDGDEDQIQVLYNDSAGALTLRVFDTGEVARDLVFSNVGSGWHSVEFVWEAAPEAAIAFSVNGADDLTATINTSGISLQNAHLGNVGGATSSGATIDFDDFDSRRVSRPGRLCRGLTVPEGTGPGQRAQLALADVSAVFTEVSSFGANPAGGQPDFDENGSVTLGDVSAIFSRVSSFQTSCDLNR